MTTIIAARFHLREQAQAVIDQLEQAGLAIGRISSFYINPPGQHGTYPIGGDRYQSPGTGHEMASGSAIRRIVEAVIGVQCADNGNDVARSVALRRAGMRVAVELINPEDRQLLVELLLRFGAEDLEEADGKIVSGQWQDFDPLSEPHYVK